MFSLGGQWPPASRGKTKPRYSGTRGFAAAGYAYGAITLYGGAFQPTSASPPAAAPGPTTPHLPRVFPAGFGLGSPPFGRPYSGDPCWFLFLPLLRCFRSGGSRSGDNPGAPGPFRPRQEAPFGDPGFYGCLRLPRAYRSLPRPSSAPDPSHPPGGLLVRWRGLNAGGGNPRRLVEPRPPAKEVIRPQVPLRPPCYDFAPLGGPRLDPPPRGYPRGRGPRRGPPRVARRAVCARGRDVFTARW